MKRKLAKRLSLSLLSAVVASGIPLAGMPLPIFAVETEGIDDSIGMVKRAPESADLEKIGNLDWIHFSSKNREECPGKKAGLIGNITLTGTIAQIMTDGDTNFIYEGAPEDNHKGQVINQIGGKTTFSLPASTSERYVSIFTGSWASQITLKAAINGEEVYSNVHGKENTSDGAESFLSQFHYHTESDQDEVLVTIETTKVYSDYYGNHSIQAIALSDKPQNLDPEPLDERVSGEVSDIPALVNLTKQGTLDWVQLDSASFGSFNRKDLPAPLIDNMTLIGSNDYVNDNSPSSYTFSDGMSPVISPDGNKKALVFTGEENGFSFTVPASTTERHLGIYTGAWASDISVQMEINDKLVYSNSFGSKVTTAGSPAKYQLQTIHYRTDSEEDTVKVTVKVGKTYDSTWGNMNVTAITLYDQAMEDDGSIISCKAQSAPASVNLSEEGNLDWLAPNAEEFASYERKNLETHLLSDLKLIGQSQSNPLTLKTKTGMSWNDGTTTKEQEDQHIGYVFLHEGSGFEVSLPASTDWRYLSVYAGAWASHVKAEVLVNDKVQASTIFGSSSTVPDTTNYQRVSIAYKTVKADDSVKLRLTVDKVFDAEWGNFNMSAISLSDTEPSMPNERIDTENWKVDFTGGMISELKTRIGDELYNIPMRTDQYGGFSWVVDGTKVSLSTVEEKEDGSILYKGKIRNNGKDIEVGLSYSLGEQDDLQIHAFLTNKKDETVSIDKASLQLGFNTYLADYPDYNNQLFPSLLRCEKTHLWGYLSTPSGRIMTIASDAPVASYTLDYQSGQHRIYSASLDVLQSGKLPERHPEGLDHLDASETKEWTISLKPVDTVNGYEKVKPLIAKRTKLPTLNADRYTMTDGETSKIEIFSASALKNNQMTMKKPDGTTATLAVSKKEDGKYTASFNSSDYKAAGVYTLTAENEDGYISQMNLTIRNDWSWYIQKARTASIEAPQKGSSHAETYYGFYSAYIAKKYFPDAAEDTLIDAKFEECYPLMYNPATGLPTSWANRIQNHSTTMGIFIDMYEASGNEEALAKAEGLCDFLLTTQHEDGGYYNGNTDYTSVIYPAKSIMELAKVEKRLKDSTDLDAETRDYYKERYELHMDSLARAMDKLVRVDGNIDTEGQGTFEDGANSCAIAELSEFALMYEEGSEQRTKYMNAAIEYNNRHVSHQQIVVPDSRYNGGTLRFWEAQYDVEMGLTASAPNMMNSPHGWTAWSIYGQFNLYELTGDVKYLERGMNTMGSCAQLMGFDGKLNWAFVPDPVRETNLFVKDEENSTEDTIVGKHVPTRIGEQYVPMISYWWKAPKNTWVPGYTAMGGAVTQGACCDNDVHEVFKAMGEVALTKAYVVEKEDGSLETYNAIASKKADGSIEITPSEDVVSNVSVQLKNDADVTVSFYNGAKTQSVKAGSPVWVSTAENVDLDQIDRDCDLKSLDVKDDKGHVVSMDKAFDSKETDYLIALGKKGGTLTITPAASSEKATLYVDGEEIADGASIEAVLDGPYMEKTVRITVKSERQAAQKTYVIRLHTFGSNVDAASNNLKITAGSEHSSTGSEGPASNAFDGSTGTIWHTKYNAGTIAIENRWIQAELDQPETIEAIRYLPRQDSSANGTILKADIMTSMDGTNWTTSAKAEWANDRTWKVTTLDSVEAKFIRIAPTQTVGDFSSAAEIQILVRTGEPEEPVDHADFSQLEMALKYAEKLDENLFQTKGWETLAEAIETSQALIELDNEEGLVSQEIVNAQAEELNAALLDIRLKPDSAVLNNIK